MRFGARMSKKKSRGFTLIELMIAITVGVILATIGAMAMRDFFLRSRLRSAADDLAGQIAIARAEAMRLDRETTVLFTTTSSTVWCAGGRQFSPGGTEGITNVTDADVVTCDCSTSDSANCVVAAKTSLVNSTDYDGVELTGGGSTSLRFNRKLGTLFDLTAQTVNLQSQAKPDRYRLNIVVTPMGHARVCIPAGYVNFGGYKTC